MQEDCQCEEDRVQTKQFMRPNEEEITDRPEIEAE